MRGGVGTRGDADTTPTPPHRIIESRQLEAVKARLRRPAMRTHAGGPSSGPSSDPASGHPSGHHRSGLTQTNPQVGRRDGASAYWSDSLRCACMHAHRPLEDQTVASSATERDQLMRVELDAHRVLTTNHLCELHFASIQRTRARLFHLHGLRVLWRIRQNPWRSGSRRPESWATEGERSLSRFPQNAHQPAIVGGGDHELLARVGSAARATGRGGFSDQSALRQCNLRTLGDPRPGAHAGRISARSPENLS